MRILIAGAGAIGSAIAGFLSLVNDKVECFGRKEHIERINKEGLRIQGIWGDKVIRDLKGHFSTDTLRGKFDVIIISTKSFDTLNMTEEVLRFSHENTVFFSFQNGVVNSEVIAEIVGKERCSPSRVIFGAQLLEPGRVEITVYGGEVLCGPFMKSEAPIWAKEKIKEVVRMLDKSGIPSCYEEDVFPFLWEKMLYNCALNPLSAIFNVSYGKVYDNPHTREIMKNVLKEVFEILPPLGVRLRWDNHNDYWEYFSENLIPPTRAHVASMAVDLRKRGKTEISAMNGYIVKKGNSLGVPVPFNQTLTLMIKYMEKEMRGLL